jgi:hypothetical protein
MGTIPTLIYLAAQLRIVVLPRDQFVTSFVKNPFHSKTASRAIIVASPSVLQPALITTYKRGV